MAHRASGVHRPLVGRAGETDAVVGLVQDAAEGQGGALLISGEAGVGRTALAREASAHVGEVADVLWAPCLPLTSLAVPFLPLTSALREWAAAREVPVPAVGGSSEKARPGSTVGRRAASGRTTYRSARHLRLARVRPQRSAPRALDEILIVVENGMAYLQS